MANMLILLRSFILINASVFNAVFSSPKHASFPAGGREAAPQPGPVHGLVPQEGSHCSGQHRWRGGLKSLTVQCTWTSFMVYNCMSAFLSCCCTAWLVSSVYGACSPVNILGRRLPRLLGDLMANVRHDNWMCPLFITRLLIR